MGGISGVAGQPYNSDQVPIIVVCSVLLFISFTAVCLRLLARYLTRTWWWWDDTLCILAMLASWIVSIFTIICVNNGLGRHMSEIDADSLVYFGLFYWMQEIAWCFSMWFIIEGIMWYYLRLFPLRWMKIAFWGIGAFTTAWLIMSILVLVFQCKPVQYFWDRQLDGACIDLVAFYLTNSATNMVTLVITLCLPLPVVFRLQASTAKKIGLCFALSLGVFVCGISIYRLVAIHDVDPTDLAWTSTGSLLWSAIESNVAVVSACIPSMVPLLLIMLGKKHPMLSTPGPTATANGTTSHVHRTRDYFNPETRSESVKALIKSRQGHSDSHSARPPPLPMQAAEQGIQVTREVVVTSKPKSQDSVLRSDGLQPSYALE